MAVVQNGTRADERCVVGQVWEIPGLIAEQRVGAPAVLIIGEVVTLHPDYVVAYAQNLVLTY
jgi:uroporphyrin-III C-methyltransferase